MEVKLLQSYPDECSAYRGAGICIGVAGTETNLKVALANGHYSVVEHLPLTIEIDGISRTCSHQLVRHRIASYSQASQRYIKLNKHSLNTISDIMRESLFTSIEEVDKLYEELDKYIKVLSMKEFIERGIINYPYIEYLKQIANNLIHTFNLYSTMLEDYNFKPEDARDVLPSSIKTSLVMTLNARSLIEICKERLCEQAQEEIRILFYKIKELIQDVYPTVYKYCEPKCHFSKCIERRPCSRKGVKNEFKEREIR